MPAPPGKTWPSLIGIYAILDTGTLDPSSISQVAAKMWRSGVRFFQVRAKGWNAGAMVTLCQRIREVLPKTAIVVVNDRADVALTASMDGVHVGDEDLPLECARRVVGSQRIVGYSTHSVDEVIKADPTLCDYVGFGPVFETDTKRTNRSPLGIEGLQEACRVARVPVVAIGGIRIEHLPAIRSAGASGAAMISGLLMAPDPGAMARRAVETWEGGLEPGPAGGVT